MQTEEPMAQLAPDKYARMKRENHGLAAPKVKLGDRVQWTSGGVDQFATPRKITRLSEDGEWAFVEGSDTGIPIAELVIIVEAITSDRPITIAFGTSRTDKSWENKPTTLRKLIARLKICKFAKNKDGTAFLQGALTEDGSRAAENMATMDLVVFDVENGQRPEEIMAAARAACIEILAYGTFNHLCTETKIRTDELHRWAKLPSDAIASLEQALEYLRKENYPVEDSHLLSFASLSWRTPKWVNKSHVGGLAGTENVTP
jgi:hypothetical protein